MNEHPDNWFHPGREVRLDGAALDLLERFRVEIEGLEASGPERLEYFYESIIRDNYFTTLENYAKILGVAQTLAEIYSRHQSVFDLARSLMSQPQSASVEQMQNLTTGYKAFLSEVKSLFETFKTNHPGHQG